MRDDEEIWRTNNMYFPYTHICINSYKFPYMYKCIPIKMTAGNNEPCKINFTNILRFYLIYFKIYFHSFTHLYFFYTLPRYTLYLNSQTFYFVTIYCEVLNIYNHSVTFYIIYSFIHTLSNIHIPQSTWLSKCNMLYFISISKLKHPTLMIYLFNYN